MRRREDDGAVANVPQTQLRCTGCNRRLGDLVNEIQQGQVILELKCPRCGQPHLELIRPLDLPDDARLPRTASKL